MAKKVAVKTGGKFSTFSEFSDKPDEAPHWTRPFRWELPSQAWDVSPQPAVDVIERDLVVLIRVALPGFEKEEVRVLITNHSVTVNADKKQPVKKEVGAYHRNEIAKQALSRIILLPAEVSSSDIKAYFARGLLELILTKVQSPDW